MTINSIHGDLIHTEEGVKTCDLYLAAFFVSAGCPIKKTYKDPKRVYFLFENPDMIERLREDYFTRRSNVIALTYADNIKSLKSLCASITDNLKR